LRKMRKPSTFTLMTVSSIIVGSLLFLFIIRQTSTVNFDGNLGARILANATFRDEKLVVYIRNLTDEEVEVSTVYLVGHNVIDYEMFVNKAIKPGEGLEIETNIKQPTEKGTYKVRISLSNGSTVECDVEVWTRHTRVTPQIFYLCYTYI